jgi:hypothetical protein
MYIVLTQMNENKSNIELLESKFKEETGRIQMDYKQNKDKVIDYLIDNILSVDIELPENIKNKKK